MHHSDLYAEMNTGMGCSSTTLGHFGEDEESVSNSSPDCSMTGYSKSLRHSQERRRDRRNALVLVQWLETHPHNPYPTKQLEKQQLARMAGITLRQLNDWFANTRRNIKKMGFEVWRKRRNGVSAVPPHAPPQPTVPGILSATQTIASQGNSKGTIFNRSAVGIVSMSAGNTSTTGVIAGSRSTPLPWFPSQQGAFLRAAPTQQSNVCIPIQTCHCTVCSSSEMGYAAPVPPAVVGCTPQSLQFTNQQPPPTTTNLPLTSIPWTSCTPPTFLGTTGYQLSNQ